MLSCRIEPQPPGIKKSLAALDTVLIPAINMAVESLHLASNDITPIGGTTWVHNLKENGQVKNSSIDRIKNMLGKKDKEKVAKKKSSPVRTFRNLPTLKLTIPPPADDRKFYTIPEVLAILSLYDDNIRLTNHALAIKLLMKSGKVTGGKLTIYRHLNGSKRGLDLNDSEFRLSPGRPRRAFLSI